MGKEKLTVKKRNRMKGNILHSQMKAPYNAPNKRETRARLRKEDADPGLKARQTGPGRRPLMMTLVVTGFSFLIYKLSGLN